MNEIAALAGVPGAPEVLSERGGRLVVAVGDRVVKTHDPDAPPAALAARLAAAGRPELADVLLAPLSVTELSGRAATIWPRGEPVDPEGAVPWFEAGALLAHLHAVPVGDLPECGAPARLGRAIRALRELPADPARAAVLAAFAGLPGAPTGATLVHGDWHLGQLDWGALLDGYRSGRGPAVPATGDPWPAVDGAARALTVQSAAQALTRAAREQRARAPPAWGHGAPHGYGHHKQKSWSHMLFSS